MGLFSSKKKTRVFAAIYNLAGDKIENFIRQAVIQDLELGEFSDFPKNLVNSILSSPGFKLRSFFRWCQNSPKGIEYCNLIGHSYLSFGYTLGSSQLNLIFRNILNLPESQNVIIDSIEIGDADFYYWGAKYLAENYPQYLDDTLYDFEVDYDQYTNTIYVYILDPNNTYYDTELETTRNVVLDTLSFTAPSDYNYFGTYLYISYQIYDLVPIYKLDELGNPTTEIIGYEEPTEIEENLSYLIYSKDTPTTSPLYNAALSALFDTMDLKEDRTFILPPIPFRYDNRQISDTGDDPDRILFYRRCLDAAYKSLGDRKKYKQLDKSILENPSIGDLDYVYLLFGVSINTKNWAGKEYLYNFIAYMYSAFISTGSTYMAVTSSAANRSNFHYKIIWSSIQYGIMGSGSLFPDRPQWAIDAFVKSEKYATCENSSWIYFIHRENKEAIQYTYYRVSGLIHYNNVHKGKSVETTALSAFNQSAYSESMFVFPLQEGIYKGLPTLTQAQLSMSYAYLLFNCYKIQKVRWYQRGIFKVIVVVVIVIITVVITVVSKGTAAAPATKIGASLVSALISAGVGTVVANVIAIILEQIAASILSTIIAKIVTKGAQQLGLGNAIANIAGVVAGAFAMAGMMGAFSSSTLANNTTASITSTTGSIITETTLTEVGTLTGNVATVATTNVASSVTTTSILEGAKLGITSLFTSPIKLIGLSLSITDAGVKGYYADKFEDIQKKAQKLEELQNKTMALNEQLNELSNFTEWTRQILLYKVQTGIRPEDFLEVSFMCGADIAEISIDFLTSSLDVSRDLTYAT